MDANADQTSPLGNVVEVDGARLWVQIAGEGTAVVLLHPGLWDSRTWDDQWDAFAARHRVLRYDLRGYGRSDRPPGQPCGSVSRAFLADVFARQAQDLPSHEAEELPVVAGLLPRSDTGLV